MYHGHKKLDILATKNDTIYVRRPVAVPKNYWYIVHSFCSFLPTTYQCDQIGRFFKVLGDKFSLKSSPNVLWMFGLLWKHPFSCINCCGYFLGNLVKFWATLYFNFNLGAFIQLKCRNETFVKRSTKIWSCHPWRAVNVNKNKRYNSDCKSHKNHHNNNKTS